MVNKRGLFAILAGLAGSAAAQTSAPPSASPLPAPPTPPACVSPEHREFDFWVGYWDVFPTGKQKLVAHSLIEKIYAGCAIRENWMPLSPNAGGSLNNYVADDKRWHQTWLDSSNSRVEFTGGLVGSSMVMTGFWAGVNGPGKDALVRMTYSRNPDGSVRQLGEVSTDHGVTWGPSFDFTYKKSSGRPPN